MNCWLCFNSIHIDIVIITRGHEFDCAEVQFKAVFVFGGSEHM